MKKSLTHLGIFSLFALVLSGCAGGNSAERPVPNITEIETDAPETAAPENDPADEPSSEASEEEQTSALEFSDRGNVVMPETIILTLTATGEELVTWTAEEVETQFQCTGERAEPSEHGQFIAVEFEVSVEPQFETETGRDGFSVNGNNFDVLDKDGRVSNVSERAYYCLSDADDLPLTTQGGTTTHGWIAFDTDVESGYLTFSDPVSGDTYEWEF